MTRPESIMSYRLRLVVLCGRRTSPRALSRFRKPALINGHVRIGSSEKRSGDTRFLAALDQVANNLIGSRRARKTAVGEFVADSALEGTGFEPSVPRQAKW